MREGGIPLELAQHPGEEAPEHGVGEEPGQDVAWAAYAALIGYLGGRAFEDNPLWGLALGFGVAAATYVVVDVVRRARRRRGTEQRSSLSPAPCRRV